MNTVIFLEELAKNVHHKKVVVDLIDRQEESVRRAVVKNDGAALKKKLNSRGLLADLSAVTLA